MGAFQDHNSMDCILIFIHENKQLSTHIIRDITNGSERIVVEGGRSICISADS